MKRFFVLGWVAACAMSAFATVNVQTPTNGQQVGSPVQYVATATSSCNKGIASMGIYTAPGVLAYVVQGASLNTNLSLNPGKYNTVVQEWDKCGGATKTPIAITVGGGGGGNTFSNLQNDTAGWTGYALEPTSYNICNSCKQYRASDDLVVDAAYFQPFQERKLNPYDYRWKDRFLRRSLEQPSDWRFLVTGNARL